MGFVPSSPSLFSAPLRCPPSPVLPLSSSSPHPNPKISRLRPPLDAIEQMMPTKAKKPVAAAAAAEEVWEVRPGGMLVQKRIHGSDGDAAEAKPVPTIRVKVKHAGVSHEIYISSQATFGELKKMVAERTGLHPEDQKMVYKDKERDSKAFLDMAGVKDRSKVALLEDPAAQARRLLEERRAGKLQKAAKAVAAVALEVDKLASKVSALEAAVNRGERVAENDVVQLTELLMNELLKLDAVVADGDVKAQRRIQVKRVQKFVETLDAVRAKNAAIARRAGRPQRRVQYQQAPPPPPPPPSASARWEMYDLLSSLPSSSSASSTATAPSTASSGPAGRFDWELF